MELHLTTGTLRYLKGIKQEHPEVHIGAMGQDAILFYEDDNSDSFFTSRHTYDIQHSKGTLDDENSTSVHFIPIPDNKKGTMHGHLSDLVEALETTNGVMSYRTGEAVNDESFIVMIQWAQATTYSDFKHTDAYHSYLSSEALKKFRTAESLFHQSISSSFFLPLKDNEEHSEEVEDEF